VTKPRRKTSSSTFIPNACRRLLPSSATGKPNPTIYTPRAQIRGPSTLPPPEWRPEREETADPAVGGAREWGKFPFRLSRHCSTGEGKGKSGSIVGCFACVVL
jgi:hypothetical protein